MTTPGSFPVPLRPAVADLPRYVPGKSFPGTEKISSNEMPEPPHPAIIEAAQKAVETVNRYPDLFAVELRAELAAVLDPQGKLNSDNICVGTGSSAVLLAALSAVCSPGSEVVYGWRSFESYPIAIPAQHAVPVPVPLTSTWEHDLDAMLAAVTERTAAMILCTPNNPTGCAITFTEIQRVAQTLPPQVLLIVDEAYIDFATCSDIATALPLLNDHPNILVMRTFSKAFSLAGLRVGYGIGHPELIAAMTAVSVPFGVSSVAQAAARAALNVRDEAKARVAHIVSERERVVSQLRQWGYDIPDTQSNFFWLPGLGKDFGQACLEVGLVVRPFPEGIRVTVGSSDQNNRLLQAAQRFLHSSQH